MMTLTLLRQLTFAPLWVRNFTALYCPQITDIIRGVCNSCKRNTTRDTVRFVIVSIRIVVKNTVAVRIVLCSSSRSEVKQR
jgi:hypothetical protein